MSVGVMKVEKVKVSDLHVFFVYYNGKNEI